ncbi:hypothetical protein BN135_2994 [Cronobacter muytjensii 530]
MRAATPLKQKVDSQHNHHDDGETAPQQRSADSIHKLNPQKQKRLTSEDVSRFA